MSYNTADSTNNVVEVSFSQAQLNEAFSIMNRASELRWVATTETEVFSSEDYSVQRGLTCGRYGGTLDYVGATSHNIGMVSIWLHYPVQSITTFTIGDTDQTEGTDYELNDDIGQISLLTLNGVGGVKTVPVGDISITYTYGYGASHKDFAMVQGIEARIALLLHNNPLLLPQINLQGDIVVYGDVISSPLKHLIKMLPKSFSFTPLKRGFSA